jgi:hypothetical protein
VEELKAVYSKHQTGNTIPDATCQTSNPDSVNTTIFICFFFIILMNSIIPIIDEMSLPIAQRK